MSAIRKSKKIIIIKEKIAVAIYSCISSAGWLHGFKFTAAYICLIVESHLCSKTK